MLRAIRWVFFLLIGVAIGVGINQYLKQSDMEYSIEDEEEITSLSDPNQVANVVTPKSVLEKQAASSPMIGGPYQLVNQDGQDVTEKDFLGKYQMIFFGFTYCPAICPTELQKMTRVMDMLEGDMADQIIPIFISVDPERDDVDTIKEYVGQFHPKLVGLTGSVEQVEVVKKAYRVFASKVENDMMDEYMVDHSAFMYLMGPEGKNIAIYPDKDTAEKIAQDIKGRIEG